LAKVIVTIEDNPDGTVKITAEPNFETIAMKAESGNDPTAAETYALLALRKIRDASKKLDATRGRSSLLS